MATVELKSRYAVTFAKVRATKEANVIEAAEEERRRLNCPVEQAKNFLRQRGWIVFNARILPGFPSMALDIMVGKMQLTPEEVIEMAERLKERARAA